MGSKTVIVGGSVGGIRAAQALRSQGFAGEIAVIDAEPHVPYDKPPLSKGFLNGAIGFDRIQLISEKELNDSEVSLLLGQRAVGIDVSGKMVLLEGGQRISYDDLVIATGVRARPSPWNAADGVHLLRTLDDAQSLKRDLLESSSVVVVGGGFIGAEVAATASKLGLLVSIVDPLAVPIGRILGDEVGERFIGLHHANGVSTHFGTGVESISGSRGNLVVRLTNGVHLSGDIVVVGIGAIPNVEWLASSGLVLDNGVVCDEFSRAVGQANIYGLGDVARWHHPGLRRLVRVEHWTNAVEQAACVARNIVNPSNPVSYSPVPYVWSDQYDWKIQIAGETSDASRCTLVEDHANLNRFAAVYADGAGFYSGIVTVNWPRAMIQCRKLLETEKDPAAPLELLRQMVPAI